MAILVTGGAGYIGSHMVLDLVDAGEEVIVLDNLSTGCGANLPKGVPLIAGNVGDEKLVAQTLREYDVSAIIHFAASVVVPESVRAPLVYYENNTINARALLSAAVGANVKQFIFSSTAAVYGNPSATPVHEDAPTLPLSPNGRSKLMTEWMLPDVEAAYGLRYVVLRYFNVAGADPRGRTGPTTPHATHLIRVAVQAALGMRSQVDVFGTDYATPDGSCVRDYIHVSDLVRAHSAALAFLRTGGRSVTLNCGYGHGYSVLEVLDAVNRLSGRNFAVTHVGRRPGDPASIVADSSRLRSTLCWTPQLNDLDGIVADALNWQRALAHFQQARSET